MSTSEVAPSFKDAKEGVNKLMGGLSSWWSSLDAVGNENKSVDDDIESKLTGANKVCPAGSREARDAASEMEECGGRNDGDWMDQRLKRKTLLEGGGRREGSGVDGERAGR